MLFAKKDIYLKKNVFTLISLHNQTSCVTLLAKTELAKCWGFFRSLMIR